MTTSYDELLEATIRHLESLKSSGTRFVEVSPQALAGINQLRPAAKPAMNGRKGPQIPVLERPGRETAHDVTAVPSARLDERGKTSQGSPQTQLTAPAIASRPALSPEAKAAAFADLRRRALECTKCAHLVSARKNVVFGVGSVEAELLFVGEAPGADEDEQGEPFVGKAGQLLTKIIETMGLKREGVYIANILKCRPDTPGQSAGNRKPRPEEMGTCIPFLHEQIDLIRPKVLVALGGTAMEGLLGKAAGIMKLRGQWHMYRGIPLMPTFHPAYVLRNKALTEKRKVWEDMLQVMERLGLPISEKQRGFFTKA